MKAAFHIWLSSSVSFGILQRDPGRALKMTTRTTLAEIWRPVAILLPMLQLSLVVIVILVVEQNHLVLPTIQCFCCHEFLYICKTIWFFGSKFHQLKLFTLNRDGRIKGMFTGIGPRVGRAGPSVGIVVSFYEVMKYALHHRHPKETMIE